MAREVGRDLGGVVREEKNTENVLLGIFKKNENSLKKNHQVSNVLLFHS